MNNDFVYNQVYKGSIKKGASQAESTNAAVKAVDDYKKNKFKGKVFNLIESAIKEAVKISKVYNKTRSKFKRW